MKYLLISFIFILPISAQTFIWDCGYSHGISSYGNHHGLNSSMLVGNKVLFGAGYQVLFRNNNLNDSNYTIYNSNDYYSSYYNTEIHTSPSYTNIGLLFGITKFRSAFEIGIEAECFSEVNSHNEEYFDITTDDYISTSTIKRNFTPYIGLKSFPIMISIKHKWYDKIIPITFGIKYSTFISLSISGAIGINKGEIK